ncbi:MAG: hypothetical protein EPN55_03960 [Gammaproteobacteria bacterium]|nr:MAG: hypothetical protein EPN55_03960 [Gammaproteobacteria bacterium]
MILAKVRQAVIKQFVTIAMPNMQRLFFPAKEARNFAQWCKEKPQVTGTDYRLDTYLNNKGAPEVQTESFFQDIAAQLKVGAVGTVTISRPLKYKNKKEYILDGPGAADLNNRIEKIDFTGDSYGKINLKSLTIVELVVRRGTDRGLLIQLSNCRVGKITVTKQPGVEATSFIITSCNIGTFVMESEAIRDMEVTNGCILNFRCPAPDAKNPFMGSVSFKDVFFPRDTKNHLLTGPQPYRNLRAHLRKLENTPAANLFHGAELAVERENDTWTNQAFSKIYEVLADFGGSVLRPLLWWLLLFALSILVVLNNGGVVKAINEQNVYVGWREVLVSDGIYTSLVSAFYVCIQAVVNPLGIFGYKALLIPVSPWVAMWLSFHSVISLVLIALLIVALRRRFKIQQSTA